MSRYDKVSLSAWLLLLLRDGESYGRALFGRLSDRGIPLDPGLGYRTLRALDDDGAITSRWTESDHGPRRRSYRLTRKGRRTLAEFAATITATWQLHETFVRAHERARRGDATIARHGRGGEAEPAHEPVDPERSAIAGSERAGDASAPSDDAPAPRVPRELLTAWLLLLLLYRGESYGYGLRRALDEYDVGADPGTVYRILRALERDEWVESRWMMPEAGPRRRLYRLTASGHRNLDKLAVAITATRDSHAAFLHAYEHKRTNARARRRPDGLASS